nr:probable protein phosphatase 2C 27 [Tanacetum cinerariifolium]
MKYYSYFFAEKVGVVFSPPSGGNGLSRYRTDFHEIKQIGIENFNCVFKVLKRIDGCMYAVKRSIKKLYQDAERQKALMEVQAIAALEHTESEHEEPISEPEPDDNDDESDKQETSSNDKEIEQEDNSPSGAYVSPFGVELPLHDVIGKPNRLGHELGYGEMSKVYVFCGSKEVNKYEKQVVAVKSQLHQLARPVTVDSFIFSLVAVLQARVTTAVVTSGSASVSASKASLFTFGAASSSSAAGLTRGLVSVSKMPTFGVTSSAAVSNAVGSMSSFASLVAVSAASTVSTTSSGTCLNSKLIGDDSIPFYGVFDGHGGEGAPQFVPDNLPRIIVNDANFPLELEQVVTRSFMETDDGFARPCALEFDISSGTIALSSMIFWSQLLVFFVNSQ